MKTAFPWHENVMKTAQKRYENGTKTLWKRSHTVVIVVVAAVMYIYEYLYIYMLQVNALKTLWKRYETGTKCRSAAIRKNTRTENATCFVILWRFACRHINIYICVCLYMYVTSQLRVNSLKTPQNCGKTIQNLGFLKFGRKRVENASIFYNFGSGRKRFKNGLENALKTGHVQGMKTLWKRQGWKRRENGKNVFFN